MLIQGCVYIVTNEKIDIIALYTTALFTYELIVIRSVYITHFPFLVSQASVVSQSTTTSSYARSTDTKMTQVSLPSYNVPIVDSTETTPLLLGI